MLPDSLLLTLLPSCTKLSEADLKHHLASAQKAGVDLESFVLQEGIVDEKTLYTTAAKEWDVPFVVLKGKEIDRDALTLIPQPLAEAHQVVAFEKSKKELSLALLDPLDLQTIEFISKKTGLTPVIHITTPSDIKLALRAYRSDIEDEFQLSRLSSKKGNDPKELAKIAEELPIINIVKSILEHAVFEGASDIHIEPTEKEMVVRYRIDGVLQTVMTLPKPVQSGIVARLKILTNLKIDEHMIPQDGRFTMLVQDEKLSFRVSIIPVYDGEKIVMRLLHEGQKPLTLDQLGFLPGPRKLVEEAIGKPHGMILVTGPTGSGKTTTLYSLLGILNQPDVNISTIEDPIEYHVQGINQSQINPRVGFTFASGLRAFLRQDPDIIMVGEIRDKETAEIAIHAAMTGHLVLSTLHTNDAPTTLPRLMDMDIPPFLVAFTANIIVAQRLVRKVCDYCKKEYTLEADAVAELEKLVSKKDLLDLFSSQKMKLSAKEKNLDSLIFYQGAGCSRCSKSGYKGRVGIYEVMPIDKPMIEKINARASAEELKDLAKKQGMITMLQDGIFKAKQGVTTLEEVLRATRD